ncbi:hypothetical protein UlMin_046237 [Ulmus minor]
MKMEDHVAAEINLGSPISARKYIDEVSSYSTSEMLELESCMEVLTKVDLDLAYSSEKLVNLHGLLVSLLAQENDLEEMAVGNSYTSPEFMEKALGFNLLSGILDSEVRELDSFMVSLQEDIVDVHPKLSSCRHVTGLHVMEDKLLDSEESLKQTQHQISEVKMQSAKLQRTVSAFAHHNWKDDNAKSSEFGELSDVNDQSNLQMSGQRYILKMLEKSLARELDLEKKLAESKKSEEELKLKLHYTEQVAFRMEETAFVVWGRFLEAENSSVVLKGISHELLGRLQLVHFTSNSLVQRESEWKSKYEDCFKQLKEKDAGLQPLKSSTAEYSANNAELSTLREKVRSLEEQLKESQLQLKNANDMNNLNQAKLGELETVVDSLKESIDVADTRAEIAELKVAELTGTNVEITEELNFLKGSASNSEKKVGILEKQLREAEIQLQHGKVSSEASQEQQNMLYSAIWDMETLIEELKSKAAKAENKIESTEESCILLSETNAELNKELNILRTRINFLEASLDQAKHAKFESANEINERTKFITDMVMQLAIERERVQKQLDLLTKENKILASKLSNSIKHASFGCNNKDDNGKASPLFKNNLTNVRCAKSSLEELNDPLGKSFQNQLDELLQDAPSSETSVSNSISVNNSADSVPKLEAPTVASTRCLKLKYVLVAILITILSMSVMFLLDQKPSLVNDF